MHKKDNKLEQIKHEYYFFNTYKETPSVQVFYFINIIFYIYREITTCSVNKPLLQLLCCFFLYS